MMTKRFRFQLRFHAPLAAVLIIGLCSLGLFLYIDRVWQTNLRQHLPALVRLHECRVNLGEAHLWLEEIITGETDKSIAEIWRYLDRAEQALDAVLYSKGNQRLAGLKPMVEPAIKRRLIALRPKLKAFRLIAGQRWQKRSQAGVGTPLDQRLDKAFAELAGALGELEKVLLSHFSVLSARQKTLHWVVLAVLACLLIFATGVLVYLEQGRRRAEAERRRLESHLRQTVKMEALGTLAGGVAHDFNNILAAIMGYCELAQEATKRGRPVEQELKMVLKAALRARDLVRQILAFSRKSEPRLKEVDLNRLVSETASMLAKTIPRMIETKTHLASDLPRIWADPGQVQQILLNLGSNAADAMPESGVLTIETTAVTLDREYAQQHLEVKPGDYVLLKVIDNGLGMDPQTKGRIFDPFFTTKEVGKGTGMGLATVFGIVKGHQGHITCYSEEGQGSEFHVYLPVARPMVAPARLSAEGPLQRGHGETILLVDDEEPLRQMGRRILEEHGYEVLTAADGQQALEVFQEKGNRIDLVVLDISMPTMSGHRCLTEMKRLEPQVKVIIASGYSHDGREAEVVQNGALAFVSKPFRKQDFLAAVSQGLATGQRSEAG